MRRQFQGYQYYANVIRSLLKIPAAKPALKLWLASLAGGALNYFSIVVIARSLGQADFGLLLFVLTLAQVLATLSAYGAASYWLKIFGKIGYLALEFVPSTLLYWRLTSIFAVVAFTFFGFLSGVPRADNISFIALLTLIPAQGMLDLASAKLQLEGRLARLAALQFLPHLLRLLGVYLVSNLIDTPERYAFEAAIGLSSIITLLICVAEVRKILHPNFDLEEHSRSISKRLLSHIDTPGLISVFRSSSPFGAINLLHLAYTNSGTILAFYFLGEEKAALFSPAAMLIFAAYLFPGVLYTKVLGASMHRKYHSNKRALLIEYRELSARMFFVGLVTAGLVYVICPSLIRFFFSEDYSASEDLVKILALSIPLYFATYAYDILTVTSTTVILKIKIMIVLIIMSTALISIGAITNGLIGVAYSIVLMQLIAFLLYRFLGERVSPAS
jgi:O-antigen/teichoic acid export membrane protein